MSQSTRRAEKPAADVLVLDAGELAWLGSVN